jgi:spore germination protein
MKRKGILIGVASILLLVGCNEQRIQQPSLENLGMISVMAFDYVDEETIKMTVIMPQPALESKEHTQVFSIESDMLQKGIAEITTDADKTVTLTQLRVVLFSEELARKGKVRKIIEHLYEDPDVRSNTYVGIGKDSAEAFLTSEYPDKQGTSVYINNIFQPKPYTFFNPFTTIHDFVNDDTNPLKDAIAPYIVLEKGLITIEGVAAFKEENMTQAFTQQQGRNIQLMRGKNKLSILPLSLDKEKAVLEFLESSAKIKSNLDIESPKITITLKLEGLLTEYEGEKNLADPKDLQKIEKEISKSMKEEITNMIQECQRLSIDPVGFFEPFRMRYKGEWPSDLTKELLEKAEFEIKVETTILGAGATK